MFKVGDKVIDFQFGYGVVITTDYEFWQIGFVVQARFDKGKDAWFTAGGKAHGNAKYPTLFKADDYPGSYPQHERPRPDLKVDDKVLVTGKLPRHFAGWDKDGTLLCWNGGRTSFTGDGQKTRWPHYEVVDKQ